MIQPVLGPAQKQNRQVKAGPRWRRNGENAQPASRKAAKSQKSCRDEQGMDVEKTGGCMELKKMGLSPISILLFALMLSLPGCGSSGNTIQQATFSTVQKGEVSPAIDNATQVIIVRSDADWATFWDRLYTTFATKPALPAIDFNENAIVAIVDAPRSSGGYSVAIDSIQMTPSGIIVKASQASPGQGCFVTLSLMQPFHIVTIPMFAGVATLELSQSVYTCGP